MKMNLSRMLRALTLSIGFLVPVLLAPSCASTKVGYEGPRLSSNQVATVTGMSPFNPINGGSAAYIQSVDSTVYDGKGVLKVELLPGLHKFKINCKASSKYNLVETEATLEAGKSYAIYVGLGPGGKAMALIR